VRSPFAQAGAPEKFIKGAKGPLLFFAKIKKREREEKEERGEARKRRAEGKKKNETSPDDSDPRAERTPLQSSVPFRFKGRSRRRF